ncbi:hypothetical protein LguiA_003460 [Lonicera macranthoides]
MKRVMEYISLSIGQYESGFRPEFWPARIDTEDKFSNGLETFDYIRGGEKGQQNVAHTSETGALKKLNRDGRVTNGPSISGSTSEEFEQPESGAVWDIFRRQDVPKLEQYLRKHFKEFRFLCVPGIRNCLRPLRFSTGSGLWVLSIMRQLRVTRRVQLASSLREIEYSCFNEFGWTI